MKVVLPAVTKETEGNIAFNFRDTECPWWKGGIVFDFIELKKIEWTFLQPSQLARSGITFITIDT